MALYKFRIIIIIIIIITLARMAKVWTNYSWYARPKSDSNPQTC